MPLLQPKPNTLKRYGLSAHDWQQMADEQDHRCFVCKQEPKKGRLCIDHQHVKGWKKKPPEERKKYVRGLLCFRCNTTYVGRSITLERAKAVVEYLQRYESHYKSHYEKHYERHLRVQASPNTISLMSIPDVLHVQP